MIVIDVGACGWVEETSIEKLVERYSPDVLWAFDPYPEFTKCERMIGATRVVQQQQAAWLYDGMVGFFSDGTCSKVRNGAQHRVECFNLSQFLSKMAVGTVLKLDCEGAEYPLLEDLIGTGQDLRLGLLLVEWHDLPEFEAERDWLLGHLRCRVEEWP